jgi:transposase-like protein
MLREEKRLGRPLEKIIPETFEKYGNMEETARALGLKYNTLYIWVIRLGLIMKTSLIQR